MNLSSVNIHRDLGGQYSGIGGSVLSGIGGAKLPEYANDQYFPVYYSWGKVDAVGVD
jgi:hypothetical protein